METLICLAVGYLEIEWGKYSSFHNHSDLFQVDADVTLVPYHYRGDDQPDGVTGIVTEQKIGLSKPLRLVKDRLELLGYTMANAERDFYGCAKYSGFNVNEFPFAALAGALANIDVETVDAHYNESEDDFGWFFKRQIAPRLGFDNSLNLDVAQGMENLSAHSILRLLAENRNAAELPVVWAYGDIEAGPEIKAADFIGGLLPDQRFLIVTEGSSDAAIIKHGMKLLRPHIADFFHFVDMKEGYPFSGTGNVHNFVRGLIAIAIQNDVLVLFDNDTAGVSSYRQTVGLTLPPNMRVLKLPYIEAFTMFNCMGPTGFCTEDINGRAASIECYLDLDSHAYVRWSNNPSDTSRQGKLIEKRKYMKRFLRQKGRLAGYDYDRIELVLDMIVAAAVDLRSHDG